MEGGSGMIDNIGNFLENAGGFYLVIAIIGSIIFIIQAILTISGLGHANDIDADISVGNDAMDDLSGWDGLHMFTFRGIVAFLTFFGWAGYFWGDKGWGGLIIAVLSGAAMMFLTGLVVWWLMKLQHSGNIPSEALLQEKGVVYLSIPGERKGKGQVTVSLSKCTRTVNALSDTELKTGTPVKVVEMIDNDLYIVEALTK